MKPVGLPTCGLHDRLVDRAALRLGQARRLEDAPVVARHHLDELEHLDVPVLEQARGHSRLGLDPVPLDERVQSETVGRVERLDVDLFQVDPLAEGALGVIDVGHATRHPGREVASRRPEDDHQSARHVLAAVIPHSFDHRGGAGVAHAEALPHLAADEHLAGGGAVEDDVARDDLLFRGKRGARRRPHHQPAAREALAEVVVRVTVQAHGHAAGHEGPETLARRAEEGERDGVLGQAFAAVTPADLRAQ